MRLGCKIILPLVGLLTLASLVSGAPSITGDNAVLRWNAVMLDAIRTETTPPLSAAPHSKPVAGSKEQ